MHISIYVNTGVSYFGLKYNIPLMKCHYCTMYLSRASGPFSSLLLFLLK